VPAEVAVVGKAADKAGNKARVASRVKAVSKVRAAKAAKVAPVETKGAKGVKADPVAIKAGSPAAKVGQAVIAVVQAVKEVDQEAKGAARHRVVVEAVAAVVLPVVVVSKVAVEDAAVAARVRAVRLAVVAEEAQERAAEAMRPAVVDVVAAASPVAEAVRVAEVEAAVDLEAAVAEVAAVEPKFALNYCSRRAVTLLELLISLALSIVVLSTIAMAINVYFKMLDIRRTSLEEMQVVRVVTQRMTNDLLMMVQPNEPDLSGLETAMNNAMQAAAKQVESAAGSLGVQIGGTTTGGSSGGGSAAGGGGTGGQAGGGQQGSGQQGGGGQAGNQAQGGGGQGGNPSSGGQAGSGQGQSGGASQGGQSSGTGQSGQSASGGTGTSGTASASGTASGDATATTEEATKAAVVQLVGSAAEMRFDISRLPRVDQYQGILTQAGELSATDLPSDVKTIVYFIRSEQSAQAYAGNPNEVGGEASTDGYGRGLMRAELDRAVNLYAESAGSTDSVYAGAQLLADEVVGLGFEYFDGTEWLTEWDSATSGGLPRAIRIWLSIQPTYGMSEEEIANASAGKEVESTDFYFVISLPTAPLVAASTTESTETTDTGTSSSSSTSTSSTTQGTTP
jgi:hypothetical protein